MTGPSPRPKRRHWRWLAAVVIAFASCGLVIRSSLRAARQDRWAAAVRDQEISAVCKMGAPTRSVTWLPPALGNLLVGRWVTVDIQTSDQLAAFLANVPRETPHNVLIGVDEVVGEQSWRQLVTEYPNAIVLPYQ